MEKKITLLTKQMKHGLILLFALCLFFAGSITVSASDKANVRAGLGKGNDIFNVEVYSSGLYNVPCCRFGEETTLIANVYDTDTNKRITDTSGYNLVWYLNDVESSRGKKYAFTPNVDDSKCVVRLDICDSDTNQVYSTSSATIYNFYKYFSVSIEDNKLYANTGEEISIYADVVIKGEERVYYDRDFSKYNFKWYKKAENEGETDSLITTTNTPEYTFTLNDESQFGEYYLSVSHINSKGNEEEAKTQTFTISRKSDYVEFYTVQSQDKAKAGDQVTLSLKAKDYDGNDISIPDGYSFKWCNDGLFAGATDSEYSFTMPEGSDSENYYSCELYKDNEYINSYYYMVEFDINTDNITFKSNMEDTGYNSTTLYMNEGEQYNIAFEAYQNGEKIDSLPQGYTIEWYQFVHRDSEYAAAEDGYDEIISGQTGFSYNYTHDGQTYSRLIFTVKNKDGKKIYNFYIHIENKKNTDIDTVNVSISGAVTGVIGESITWNIDAKDGEGNSVDLSAYNMIWYNNYYQHLDTCQASETYTFTVDEGFEDTNNIPSFCLLQSKSDSSIGYRSNSLNFRLITDGYINAKINGTDDGSYINVKSTDQSLKLTVTLYDAEGKQLDASDYDLQWQNSPGEYWKPMRGKTGDTYEIKDVVKAVEVGNNHYRIAIYDKTNPNKLLDSEEVTLRLKDDTPCTHSGETEIKGKIDATCTTDGYTGDTFCKDCEEKLKDGQKIPATGHKTTVINQKSASYTEDGYTGDTYCENCKQIIEKGSGIAKLVLAAPTSLKVKAAKKSFTVSFKKAKAATGTQIQYSNFKSMKKAKSKLTTAKSAKIKKLVSKKKYYVRVRSYKKIGTKKVYSKWSAIKAVKVK